ncbi:unnamed protein product [Adineta steineri]|uniref:Cytochrome P450 n=1 Tax=Adineta steineri TaxID=433720 RepID=A0A814LQK2_9BILA|nr:unnamed protein product [Adineta steineri]CAF4091568.1 unnamed protein product [Adineta steineri]
MQVNQIDSDGHVVRVEPWQSNLVAATYDCSAQAHRCLGVSPAQFRKYLGKNSTMKNDLKAEQLARKALEHGLFFDCNTSSLLPTADSTELLVLIVDTLQQFNYAIFHKKNIETGTALRYALEEGNRLKAIFERAKAQLPNKLASKITVIGWEDMIQDNNDNGKPYHVYVDAVKEQMNQCNKFASNVTRVCQAFVSARKPGAQLLAHQWALLQLYVFHELPVLIRGVYFKSINYSIILHPTIVELESHHSQECGHQRDAIQVLLDCLRQSKNTWWEQMHLESNNLGALAFDIQLSHALSNADEEVKAIEHLSDAFVSPSIDASSNSPIGNSLSRPFWLTYLVFLLPILANIGIWLLTTWTVFGSIVSLVIAAWLALWHSILQKGKWSRRGANSIVLGTPFRFPFGDLPSMQTCQNGYYLNKIHQQLGHPKVYRIWMGPQAALMLAHPDSVRQFWNQHNERMIERDVKLGWPLIMLMSQGLGFKSYADRNRINKYFHGSFASARMHLFETHIEQTVISYIDKILANKPHDTLFDMQHELKYLAHDVGLHLFCGAHATEYLSELHEIVEELEELMSITFDAKWLNVDGIHRLLPASYRLRSRISSFRARFMTILIKLIDHLNYDNDENDSVLARFVRDLNACEITFEEFMDTTIEGLLAPTEGSAATFTYTLILLAQYPHVQAKLRESIRHLGNSFDLTHLHNVHYLDHILVECQRLYPIFMFNVPELASSDMVIDDICLPKNTMVILDVVSLNRNENVWPQALVFKPERFETITEEQRKAVHAFGNGRSRRCLGEHMIKAMHKLLVAHIVQRYEISLPEPIETIKRKRRPFIYVPEQLLHFTPL